MQRADGDDNNRAPGRPGRTGRASEPQSELLAVVQQMCFG